MVDEPKAPRRLVMDCEICGEPVQLSPRRYLRLLRAKRKPRCRRNGCERLCGAEPPRTARIAASPVYELVSVVDGTIGVYRRKDRRPRKNGELEKLAAKRLDHWRYEASVEIE